MLYRINATRKTESATGTIYRQLPLFTISGIMHGIWDKEGAKVIAQEIVGDDCTIYVEQYEADEMTHREC